MFEVRQTGEREIHTKKGPVKKPVYESVEEAFERAATSILGVKNEKVERVVQVLIPSAIQGGKPTKANQKIPCLPEPAHEICVTASELFNQEQDIAYRLGYGQGYRDKDEGKPRLEEGLELVGTDKTASFLVKFSERVKALAEAHHGPLLNDFKDALQYKRDFGYSNGYWQGYSDRAGNVMPKFHDWKDPEKEAEEFDW